MKNLFYLLIAFALLSACRNRKIETTSDTVSVAADSTTQVAPVQLAFSPIDNYFLKNTVKLPDTVNFLIINGQAEFDELFGAAKTATNTITPPDFIINHTIAIACQPTDIQTMIEVEKVELRESTIKVFAHITRGQKQSSVSTPSRVFAVEKRDGVTGMDFYLDNKMVISLMLPSI